MFAVTLAEIAWRIFYALFAGAADAPSLSLALPNISVSGGGGGAWMKY